MGIDWYLILLAIIVIWPWRSKAKEKRSKTPELMLFNSLWDSYCATDVKGLMEHWDSPEGMLEGGRGGYALDIMEGMWSEFCVVGRFCNGDKLCNSDFYKKMNKMSTFFRKKGEYDIKFIDHAIGTTPTNVS